MIRSTLLLALAGALLWTGCSGPRPPLDRDLPSAFPNHSETQVRYQLLAPIDSLTSFKAKSSLAIRAPENSGSFSADMQQRKGDSLYVAISPGLGIEAARALVTPDSFFFYDRIKNRLMYGSLEQASGILPEPFTSTDLFANLLGMPAPAADVDWTIDADADHYYLRDPDERRLYVIDPSIWRVVRFEERDAFGDIIDRRMFSEFDEFDGVVIPRRLVFERPQEDSKASIYYRDLDLNEDDLRFALRVKDSTDRVPVGE